MNHSKQLPQLVGHGLWTAETTALNIDWRINAYVSIFFGGDNFIY